MQASLGAGAFYRLVVVFEVPVEDVGVERSVHAYLARAGLRLDAPRAREWFRIAPDDARSLVLAFAAGEMTFEPMADDAAHKRGRGQRGPKSDAPTPKRIAALAELEELADGGGSLSGFPGQRKGAAAHALASRLGVTKQEALVLINDMFSR